MSCATSCHRAIGFSGTMIMSRRSFSETRIRLRLAGYVALLTSLGLNVLLAIAVEVVPWFFHGADRIIWNATPGLTETEFLRRVPEQVAVEVFTDQSELAAFLESGQYEPKPLIEVSNKVRVYEVRQRILLVYVDNEDRIQAVHAAQRPSAHAKLLGKRP